MATWTWRRWAHWGGGEEVEGWEYAETEGMTPPPGDGWKIAPGQVPAGRVQGGTGSTRSHRGAHEPKSRRGDYDNQGLGKVKSTVMRDDGRHLGNTITHHDGPPPRV